MDVVAALADGMGHVLGALDGVDDEHQIAHAFAPVCP